MSQASTSVSNSDDQILCRLNVVLIDNEDSFTYNLVDELRKLGLTLTVFRNTIAADKLIEQLEYKQSLGPTILLLSPGPGAPQDAGCMPQVLERVRGKLPVLGICLGHQAIVECYGGKVGRAPLAMHGKSSLMIHDEPRVFGNLPSPMSIARYHSLVAIDVPECLQVIATIDGLAMAILHESDNMLGFQFHPESILTAQGSHILRQAMLFLSRNDKNETSFGCERTVNALNNKALTREHKHG